MPVAGVFLLGEVCMGAVLGGPNVLTVKLDVVFEVTVEAGAVYEF